MDNIHPSLIHARNFIPNDCGVIKDVEPSTFEFDDLELVPFDEESKQDVMNKVTSNRATEAQTNLGLVDGKKLLENQDKIPAGMRYYCLILLGTILCDSEGDHLVPCLYHDGERWYLKFLLLRHLVRYGSDKNRLLRVKQAGA